MARYKAPVVTVEDVQEMRPRTPRSVAGRIIDYLADYALDFTPLAQRILAFVATHARNESGAAWPGSQRIAAGVKCHPNSVSLELRRLNDDGVLKVDRAHPDHPDRSSVYVIRDRALYWHDDPDPDPDERPSTGSDAGSGEVLPHRTRNSLTPEPLIGIAGKARGQVARAEPPPPPSAQIERLRAAVHDDPRASEQARACPFAGVDVHMICWLLRHFPRPAEYIADLLGQMEHEARKPAAWLVSAIIRGYAHVSDRDKRRRTSKGSAQTRVVDDSSSVKARWDDLDDDGKNMIRRWINEA